MQLQTRRWERASAPALEIVEAAPEGDATGAPVLLLHGACSGAWCWRRNFLPAFAELGRRAVALSLRGHGNSEGRHDVRHATIEDYVEDVASVAAELARPLVVAHSLGGYLAQLLIGRTPLAGLVLVNSLPPEGLALVGPRLALTDPSLWLEGTLGATLGSRTASAAANLALLFGDRVSADDQRHYARLFMPESETALAQAHLPRWVTPAFLSGVPTLVLHAEQDRMIWGETAQRTALYHGGSYVGVAQAGHFMMLDPDARAHAELIADWAARKRV